MSKARIESSTNNFRSTSILVRFWLQSQYSRQPVTLKPYATCLYISDRSLIKPDGNNKNSANCKERGNTREGWAAQLLIEVVRQLWSHTNLSASSGLPEKKEKNLFFFSGIFFSPSTYNTSVQHRERYTRTIAW